MSVTELVPANDLAALSITDDEVSKSMRWLEMVPTTNTDTQAPITFSLKINDDANEFVRHIKDPLNLISIMGPARSGKSTLMNLLAGMKKSELFTTNPGMDTFTKGVYIPTRIMPLPQFSSFEGEPTIDATDSNVKVSFVDTEGQGAVGMTYDMNLFSSALVASKVIIYNRTGGLLTDEILTQLGMMTQAALRLRSAGGSTAETNGDSMDSNTTDVVFGHLCIVFNQFRLSSKDTVQTLQTKLLDLEPNTGSASQNRNKIRQQLTQNFESIQVFILPDDLKPEARESLNDGTKPFLLLDDFGPKYLEYFKVLRTRLSESLVSPKEMVKGIAITGAAMADFMPKFVDAINKTEPLNVPSIFEAAQNDAINKANAAFIQALTKESDELLTGEAKPTNLTSALFDKEVSILLTALSASISYMPPAIVKQTQSDAQKSADTMKVSLMDRNFTRLQAFISILLKFRILGINDDFEKGFPDSDLLISRAEIDTRCSNILSSQLSWTKAKIESFDPRALPSDYETFLAKAVSERKNNIIVKVTTAWRAWVSATSEKVLGDLVQGLQDLANNTVGEDDATYTSGEAILVAKSTSDFKNTVDQQYQWDDPEAQLTSFKSAVEETRDLRRALRSQNEIRVKKELQRLVNRLQSTFTNQLADSLTPNVEPDEYGVLTDAKALQDSLLLFCDTNKLNQDLRDDTLLNFDTFVAAQKRDYRPLYNKAGDDYRVYLLGELGRQLPLLTVKYYERIDAIALDINSPATSKTAVSASCKAEADKTESEFNSLVLTLHARQDGVISKSIIESSKSQLRNELGVGHKNKLAKYDEVVSAYNKALLTSIVVPIVDQALANKFATEDELKRETDSGKTKFDQKAAGDKDDAGDAATKWKAFMSNTYPTLVENVKRFNGFTVTGLDAKSAGTKDVQLWVIQKIWYWCANLAGSLNMSWINSGEFIQDRIEDRGTEKNPSKPNEPETRTYRMVNQFQGPGYDWERKTNLEFFGWELEVSEVIFGKPIITDLKPIKIDSSEFPLSSTPTTVQVGTRSTENSTVTNSTTESFGVDVGSSMKWGVKDSWEAAFSATFKWSLEKTDTNSSSSTYETSTQASIVLPANRTNIVNQMIFSQRTSLPYTAKVKFVPRLRFQNGFTAYGSDPPVYRVNSRTGALKQSFKTDGRVYQDFEFPRCDEIKELARVNADPWDWDQWRIYNPTLTAAYLDPLADSKTYEVYVKGKWEGITGKYAVTTVTPKETALTLMPDS